MKLTEEQKEQFRELSKPLMEWVSQNCHPHTSVILDSEYSELLEGVVVARKVQE